jgi:hypothetical protein
MARHSARFTFCIMLMVSVLYAGQGTDARSLTKPMPSITALHKPAARQMSAPGSEKFVLFAREPRGPGWNFMATAWECTVGKKSARITRRIEFVPSSWSPDVLCHQWSGGPNPYPNLVSLQVDVPNQPGGYTVNCYLIDYRTWNVKTLAQANSVDGIAVNDGLVYLSIGDADLGYGHVLHFPSATISRAKRPFTQIDDFGKLWLVQFTGQKKTAAALFDPVSEKVVKKIECSEYDLDMHTWRMLSPDGTLMAAFHEVDNAGMEKLQSWSQYGTAKAYFTLYDLTTGRSTILPVLVYATRGSGIPVIYAGLDAWFTEHGDFEYVSAAKEAQSVRYQSLKDLHLQLNHFDVKTQVTSVKPWSTRVPEKSITWPAIPSYLKVNANDPDRTTEIANAFLKYKGVLRHSPPAVMDTIVGFSKDGRRFLARVLNSEQEGFFFYCDLDTKRLMKFRCPPALKDANAMNIECIRTP